MLPSKTPLLLFLRSGDEIFWRYVLPASAPDGENSVGLKVKWFSVEQLANAEEIYLEWKHEDTEGKACYNRQRFSFSEDKNGVRFFRPIEKAVPCEENRVFVVEFKKSVNIKLISEENELLRYQHKVAYENICEERSMNRLVQTLALKESSENRVMLRFMLELNNKLDDIIQILKRSADGEETTAALGMGISARGIIFYYKEDIPDGALAYVKLTAGTNEDRFSFAAIIRISKLYNAKTGYFYEGFYDNISGGIQDLIVRSIFAAERDMIRDL